MAPSFTQFDLTITTELTLHQSFAANTITMLQSWNEPQKIRVKTSQADYVQVEPNRVQKLVGTSF